MNVEIRHSPSFAVARCNLAAGESIKAESGAMVATSAGVSVEAQMQGGLMKGLKRSVLGGESLFITTFTAPDGGGWVDCAPHLPGDVTVLDVTESLNLTKRFMALLDRRHRAGHQVGRLQEPRRRRGRLPRPRQRLRAGRRRLLRRARRSHARAGRERS